MSARAKPIGDAIVDSKWPSSGFEFGSDAVIGVGDTADPAYNMPSQFDPQNSQAYQYSEGSFRGVEPANPSGFAQASAFGGPTSSDFGGPISSGSRVFLQGGGFSSPTSSNAGSFGGFGLPAFGNFRESPQTGGFTRQTLGDFGGSPYVDAPGRDVQTASFQDSTLFNSSRFGGPVPTSFKHSPKLPHDNFAVPSNSTDLAPFDSTIFEDRTFADSFPRRKSLSPPISEHAKKTDDEVGSINAKLFALVDRVETLTNEVESLKAANRNKRNRDLDLFYMFHNMIDACEKRARSSEAEQ